MEKKTFIVSGLCIALYLVFFAVNHSLGTKGTWDNATSILLVLAMLVLSRKLPLRWTDILILNVPLLVHNVALIGNAELYGKVWIIEFDTALHVLGSASIAFVAASVARRTKAASKAAVGLLLALAIAISLGALLEVSEYLGYLYLPQTSGFFHPVAGMRGYEGLEFYIDTMQDTLANMVGAIAGAIVSLFFRK